MSSKVFENRIAIVMLILAVLGIIGDIIEHSMTLSWEASNISTRIGVIEKVVNGDGGMERPLNERMTTLEDSNETLSNGQDTLNKSQERMESKIDILMGRKNVSFTTTSNR